jgi:hypothetical protein
MSTHTAGKWTVSRRGGCFCVDAQESPGDKRKPLVRIAKTFASPYAPPAEESAANARLIAAAPDLLAACQAARELALTGMIENDVAHEAFAEVYYRAAAAIALAEPNLTNPRPGDTT